MEAAGHNKGDKEEGGKGTSELLAKKVAAVHEPRDSGDSAEAVKHNPHGRVQALQQAKQGSLAGKHSAVHKVQRLSSRPSVFPGVFQGRPGCKSVTGTCMCFCIHVYICLCMYERE